MYKSVKKFEKNDMLRENFRQLEASINRLMTLYISYCFINILLL